MKNKIGLNIRLYLLAFTLLLALSVKTYAQTTLPAFFSNHMVLQQNEEVAFWGTDSPGTLIFLTTSWGVKADTKTDKDGKWKLNVATPKAGGPYTIAINGTQEVVLNDVLIGEVWLCSGQSNMYMPMKGYTNQPVLGSNEAILHSKNNEIRLFKVQRNASLVPLHNVEGEWQSSNPATVPEFSATAYFFGTLLHEILDVPIGIISTSWGGSTVEAWMDKKTLSNLSGETETVTLPTEIPEKNINKTATLLYNAMINPFVGFGIKGALWYQGENNVSAPKEYKTLFPAMIKSWRNKWQQDKFPFYFVQIAPFSYEGMNSAFLREAQLYTLQHVENTGMAVTLDIGDCNGIHPANKKAVGSRLAYWALANAYNINGIMYSGPIYESMKVTDENKINVSFAHVANGLTSFQKALTGFEIAGKDKVYYPAQAKINRNKTVTVWSEKVKDPVAVRYAFENCAKGSLFNLAGLPASSFRTDHWEEQ